MIALLLFGCVAASGESGERPWEAIASLEPILSKYRARPESLDFTHATRLLGMAESAYAAARDHRQLLIVRRELEQLHAKAASPNDREAQQALLLARVALADALGNEGQYTEADAVLSTAQQDIVAGAVGSTMVMKGLWRARAEVRKCGGAHFQGISSTDTDSGALAAFIRGLPYADWPQSPLVGSSDLRMALDYFTLLRYSNFSGRSNAAATSRVGTALLSAGPWRRLDQLPRNFFPHLHSQPWYDADSPPWGLLPLVQALRKAAPALRAEFFAVAALDARRAATAIKPPLLLRETECIHDERGGIWRYLTVNAPWVREVDRDGCAVATPVACKLLRKARALGWGGEVLRGTYSAVDGGAKLRPHCGMTNAQIKLHVGLIVPMRQQQHSGRSGGDNNTTGIEVDAAAGAADSAPLPCASLTVVGETRAWTQGGVLVFDDSFDHYVVNSCADAERVVFQLVLPHGDARRGDSRPPSRGDGGGAGH